LTAQDYEASILAADRELRQAVSADDVRAVWRRHFGTLGHRTLGRLLLGQSVERLLDRRAEREQRE
jgi:hypothetical protein